MGSACKWEVPVNGKCLYWPPEAAVRPAGNGFGGAVLPDDPAVLPA
jgi:hypothetical protein